MMKLSMNPTHPILFNGPMVRAVLEGRKTQTRRVVKPQPTLHNDGSSFFFCFYDAEHHKPAIIERCPFGQPGDTLWVRETLQHCGGRTVWHDRGAGNLDEDRTYICVYYPADYPDGTNALEAEVRTIRGIHNSIYRGLHNQKVPAIHMPRWASRIDLLVKRVWVERVQDISKEDAKAEGAPMQGGRVIWHSELDNEGCWSFDPRVWFADLWNSIYGKKPDCSWADNPWVWAVEFELKEVRG